ncbi:MAG: penicillin acylase family protein, partial [Deltaproteobacteria bacterium]|nr:penicillin acylase family protein [Deltaproteobacteria bacterium]
MSDAHHPPSSTRRLAILLRTLRVLLRGPRPQTFPHLTREHLPPMRGRIEIIRDARGIPHIYAQEEPDLYAALGFLQAADRFLLLDTLRHLGAGRLCEWIGNPAMPKSSEIFPGRRLSDLDGFLRPLDFEAQSERDYLAAPARAKDCLAAFALGVNAALSALEGVYAPEYVLLGAVRPWRASDALVAARTCAFCVALAPLDNELTFDAVRGRLGDERARHLFPDAPWADVPSSYRTMEGPEPEPPLHLAGTGSNNWAVSAARSESGAPIFANDPHVPFLPLPTFWYHAHLECPSYRIQGGLMLGCPIFGYGHNGHLAWGITTAYRDAWDLYRIHRTADDPSRYRTVVGTGQITHHREGHKVRLGKDVQLSWESCEHGILYPGWKHHDGVDLALRYATSDAGRFFDGYLQLAAAKCVDDHRAALELINDGPFDFNHVYAHKDGHIAWEPYGRLPKRARDGLFVRDAHDPTAQWDGFLPFSQNPKMINPERGFVASANSITDPENYQALTTRVHAESRYRQTRIESQLAASTKHNVDTFKDLQSDIATDYSLPVRDAMLSLLEPQSGHGDDVAKRALHVL